jgi:CRISPR-associated protein Csm3
MSKQLFANVIIKGKIEALTGLHIGGSKEKLEIGGVDSPVIRDPQTREPYIPGSSLKGKMRMLLEFALGKVKDGNPSTDEEIVRIFGTSAEDSDLGPTRLIVRDAFPDKKTKDMWSELDTELEFTELKPENSIDRITSEANPRFLERVVKGSKFNLEMVYSIYDWDDEGKNDKENLGRIIEALKLLEHSGIGGNVSRGYGQVKIKLCEPIVVSTKDYQTGGDNYLKADGEIKDDNLKDLSEITIPEIN